MYNTMEPVTSKEFEQSLFVMLAMVAIVMLGAYFIITYNTTTQAETVPRINHFSHENGILLWDINGIEKEHVIQLEAYQGNAWLLVDTELQAKGQISVSLAAQDYRLVVKDADGNLLLQSLLK